ncbi:MAG TPA: hypothetical protein VK889_00245 [Solirubrobacterales bacterium]|nr:hypothetical protein [Solirubrobacterales bacterium]
MPPLEPLIRTTAIRATSPDAIERVLAAAGEGCEIEQPWLERVRGGLERVVDLLAADPALARAALIEPAAAGLEARRRQGQAIDRLAERLAPRPGELFEEEQLPECVALMSVGAVAGLIGDEVRTGRAEELPARLPDLLFVMLVPYLGPQVAALEMQRVAVQRGT